MMKNRFFIILCFFTFSAFPAFAEELNYNDSETFPEFFKNVDALIAIGADKAYTGADGTAYSGFSGAGVTVAVIDNGTMANHPDLVQSHSTLQKPQFNISAEKHGTHVAGIIAAEKNGSGMHGVAYNSDLLLFSTSLEGGCGGMEGCLSPMAALEALLDSEYDDVKIINNSWGLFEEDINENVLANIHRLMDAIVAKDKLIVASAGNDMELNPNTFPAGVGLLDNSFKNNVINVVAYDSFKNHSANDFIASFSNLAGDAKEWTLAAPGKNIYSSILYDETADPPAEKFAEMNGTSMAAPLVSGAAALVQEAFPYLGGKQIADILFSTAKKKKDLDETGSGLSPYMIQNYSGQTRVLFFKDNKEGTTFEEAKAAAASLGYSCGGSVSCHEVTFEDVFGQGLLDVGTAVKGIKYFDASRLTAEDFDIGKNQFYYSVDTLGMDSVWSNDIGQLRSSDELYKTANVGLRKRGEGVLTLAGANTFLGTSVVDGGELNLTGSMEGDVVVNTGTFSLSDTGLMNGKITTNADGLLRIEDSGTLLNLENNGKTLASGGKSTGNVVNNGTFSVAGGGFISSRTFTNKNNFQFETDGRFSGVLDNEGLVSVIGNSEIEGNLNNKSSGIVFVNATIGNSSAIENYGLLSGEGDITGSVVNHESGTVATTLKIHDLNSTGNIQLSENPDGLATLKVNTLNITGGALTIASGNISYENGQTYSVIEFDNLTSFENFEPQSKLSDFIVATPHVNGNRIEARIDYLRMGESAATETFLPEEKVVAGIMDKMYFDDSNKDLKGYFYLSGKELQKEINTIRSKAKPIQKEHLPLAGTMSSQVSNHLFKVNMNRDAATFHRQYRPMQQYRGRYYNRGSVGRYYRGRSGGSAPKTGNKIWGQILGGRVVEEDNVSDRGNVKTRTVGGMIGYDHEISSRSLIGITAGYASGRLTQSSDEINVNDYRAGIYTGSRFGKLTFNTMLLGGFQQYKSERYTEAAGLNALHRADFNGYSAELDVNLGYDFMRLPYRDYSFYLRSYLAANVNYISQDSYEEKGESPMLLGVDSINNTSVSIQPGITIGYTFSQAVLTADFGYQRILSGDSVQSSAYFLADTARTPFESLSAESDKDYINAGVGLKTNLTRNVELNLYAGMRKSDNTEAINFAASLSYAF